FTNLLADRLERVPQFLTRVLSPLLHLIRREHFNEPSKFFLTVLKHTLKQALADHPDVGFSVLPHPLPRLGILSCHIASEVLHRRRKLVKPDLPLANELHQFVIRYAHMLSKSVREPRHPILDHPQLFLPRPRRVEDAVKDCRRLTNTGVHTNRSRVHQLHVTLQLVALLHTGSHRTSSNIDTLAERHHPTHESVRNIG